MKFFKYLFVLLSLILIVSCGGDEDDYDGDTPSGGDGGNGQDNNNNEAKEWEINLEKSSFQKIAFGQNDIIYAAGYTKDNLYGELSGSGVDDPFLLALNTKGEKLWGKQWGVPVVHSSHNYISGLSVDTNGNIYITIMANPTIYKFSPDGAKIWEIFPSIDNGKILTLTLDKYNNLFIGSDDKIVDIVKYSDQGKELQNYNISGDASNPTTSYTSINALVVDSEGNIYAGGSTSGSLFAENAGNSDAFLVKIAPDGTQLWGKQWGNTKTNTIDDMKIDDRNNIYVVGYAEGDAEIFSKFDSNGNKIWEHTEDYTRIAMCQENIYVVNGYKKNGQVDQYNLNGEYIASSTVFENEIFGNVACDSKGNVYAVKEGALIKFSPSDFK